MNGMLIGVRKCSLKDFLNEKNLTMYTIRESLDLMLFEKQTFNY